MLDCCRVPPPELHPCYITMLQPYSDASQNLMQWGGGKQGVSFYQGRSSLHGRMTADPNQSREYLPPPPPMGVLLRDEDMMWG